MAARNRRSCAEEMAAQQQLGSPPAGQNQRSPSPEPEFLEEPSRDYYCAVSLELLIDPHQTTCCGHHLSRPVVERLQRDNKPCPMCNGQNFFTVPDIYMKRKVKELQVRCPFRGEGGCGWTGDLGNKKDHVSKCPKRPWSCPHCSFVGHLEDSNQHTQECQQVPVPCPNRCNTSGIPRCHLSEHIEKICPLQPCVCPYSHVGCKAHLPRSEMDGHIQNAQMHHMMLTCSANLDLSRQMNEKLAEKDKEIQNLREDIGLLKNELGVRVQAVEARVAIVTEWVESNQLKEGEEKEELTEEKVKVVMEGELKKMEEKIMEDVSKEVEGVVKVIGEKKEEGFREMKEEVGKVEKKIERVVKLVEEEKKMTQDHWKKIELAQKKEREVVVVMEEKMKNMMKQTEKAMVEQMKTLHKDMEEYVSKEMVKLVKNNESSETADILSQMMPVTSPSPLNPVALPFSPSEPSLSLEPLVSPLQPVRSRSSPRPSRSRSTSANNGSPTAQANLPLASLPVTSTLPPVFDPSNAAMVTGVPNKATGVSNKKNLPPCEFTIKNFSKLKEQNKEWRSEPFYSQEGYKMCLGVWPNGFRSGAGTHVSVEFYKMKDANTEKLKWNVKLPIHVRIFNFRSKRWEREHVNGETFTRSKVAGEFETSGYAQSHKLVSHDDLSPYIRDDIFRIQVWKFELKP